MWNCETEVSTTDVYARTERDECTNLGPNDKSTQTRRHMLKTIASLEMAICNAKGTSTTLQNKCIGIFSNQGS